MCDKAMQFSMVRLYNIHLCDMGMLFIVLLIKGNTIQQICDKATSDSEKFLSISLILIQITDNSFPAA